MIGPHSFTAVSLRCTSQSLGHLVECGFPRDGAEHAVALLTNPLKWLLQPIGMMDALGVASDLGAYDAVSITIRRSTPDTTDPRRGEALYL